MKNILSILLTLLSFGLFAQNKITIAAGPGIGDTASLSNRINLKLNIADTANMRPRLVAGSNVTITGTYPNLTIAASGGGGGSVTGVTASPPLASSGGTTPDISIANAAADGSTKGAASFAANDFNSSSGNISLDYTNGPASITRLQDSIARLWDSIDAIRRPMVVESPLEVRSGASEDTLGLKYRVYKALLTQSGGDDPTATVLENTLSADIVWTRSDEGQYVGTLTGAFPANKTAIRPIQSFRENDIGGAGYQIRCVRNSDNDLILNSYTADVVGTTDGALLNTLIEISVYP